MDFSDLRILCATKANNEVSRKVNILIKIGYRHTKSTRFDNFVLFFFRSVQSGVRVYETMTLIVFIINLPFKRTLWIRHTLFILYGVTLNMNVFFFWIVNCFLDRLLIFVHTYLGNEPRALLTCVALFCMCSLFSVTTSKWAVVFFCFCFCLSCFSFGLASFHEWIWAIWSLALCQHMCLRVLQVKMPF